MPVLKKRSDDNIEDQEHKNRVLFDLKTILVIISALGGGAGINLATNGTQGKIEILESKFNTYCESQKEQDALKMKMIDNKFNMIKETLKEIKDLIKEKKH